MFFKKNCMRVFRYGNGNIFLTTGMKPELSNFYHDLHRSLADTMAATSSWYENVNKYRFPIAFILICLTWGLLMILVVPVDYDWTVSLREHRIRSLDRFMGQTIFEGEALGGGDPVIVLILLAVGAYYLAWKYGASSRFYAWRPQSGFILTSALVCSFMMVHSLKWVMGRARPALVIKDTIPFSDWFVFGPHFITEGTYRGSFPSGHTAQAFVLVSIAYILAAGVPHSGKIRLIGWVWGGVSICYGALMAISRCMTLSHWFSDVLGAFGMSWILMHVIYFWMLNIPEQTRYYKKYGRHPEGPQVWELRLCAHLFGMALGGMAAMLGIRAVIMGKHWALYTLILAGIVSLGFFYRRFRLLHRQSVDGFLPGNRQ
jgi:membrane-associated phospholipid phosphatase